MNPKFKQAVETLEPSFQRLMAMRSVSIRALPQDVPEAGVYLFSEDSIHLYVGRSNTIRKRLQSHCRPKSSHYSATFAFRLARQITGMKVIRYSPDGSRSALQEHPDFEPVFNAQKRRIKEMDLRYVSESDPLQQALLEMYVAISLEAEHNDFDNH